MAIYNASGAGNQEGNSINNLQNSAPISYNKFNEGYETSGTGRFADITPFFVMDSIGDSYIELATPGKVVTQATRSPFMQSVKERYSFYSVPLSSIYHRTWSKFFPLPDKGDDVPDDVRVGFKLHNFLSALKSITLKPVVDASTAYNTIIYIKFIEGFFSNGSLLSYLRQPLPAEKVRGLSLDALIDISYVTILSKFQQYVSSNKLNPKIDLLIPYGNGSLSYTIRLDSLNKLRYIFDLIWSQNASFAVSSHNNSNDALYQSLQSLSFGDLNAAIPHVPQSDDTFYNLHRPIAYQMICAQFFSNETTDFIYSEELWRNNIDGLYMSLTGESLPSFTYNGFSVLYDCYSEHLISKFSDFNLILYLRPLLIFNQSLVFEDYFTGARTRQLAVSDITVPVDSTGKGVSAIDIAEKLSIARFAHAVNKTSSQLYAYLKGIFNIQMPIGDKMPRFIAEHSQYMGTSETTATTANSDPDNPNTSVNNGIGLGQVSSKLVDSSNSTMYGFYCNLPSVVIGCLSFSIPYMYDKAIDRHVFHGDRFDMFQPYLQTIGDQAILPEELGLFNSGQPLFGWTVRNAEYKVRFSNRVGGMVEYLPGYTISTPDVPGTKISPFFVRQSNLLFDEIFASLPNSSLAGYYHYQYNFNIQCVASYNMLRKPQIL